MDAARINRFHLADLERRYAAVQREVSDEQARNEMLAEIEAEHAKLTADLPSEADKAKEALALQLEQKAAKLEAAEKAKRLLEGVDENDPAQLRLAAKSLREQIQEAPSVLVEKKVETVAPTADPVPEADSPADPSLGEKFVQWLKS